jgi:hypothetical protein
MVATINTRWRAGSPDSSQTMFGGFGRAVCNGDYTGYGNKRSKTSINNQLKLYAHSRIISYKEFQCFEKLITKESNWRVEAINPNGKHFGLGQMRNTKYRNLDGYRMIDWSIALHQPQVFWIKLQAFEHWRKHGWH